MGRGAVYTGIFGDTLATYAPIPAVIFSFSLLLSTPDPGPDCTWPGCSSWAPTRASATRHRHPAGHTSTKIPAEIRKAMSVGLAVIAAGGNERRLFSYPSFAGGLGELRGARGWLTWRCWPENATLAHTRGALQAVVEAAVISRNGRGSGRYAGLGERKSHFLQ